MANKEITFKEFWDAYGLKKDKMSAEGAWKRLSAKDRRAAFAGITPYREECQRSGVRMMYAQGYLNHRRWEDEVEEPSPAAPQQPAPPSEPLIPGMETW